MLLLLTDENITPIVAEQVVIKRPDISITSVNRWRSGALMGMGDWSVLRAAHSDRLTLVTFDQATIPNLLTEFFATGIDHAGVIFVDDRTIADNDIGGLVRSIIAYYGRSSEWDWVNRIGFLENVR